MTITGKSYFAAASAMRPGSSAYCNPQMSFRMWTPSSAAITAVSALKVSTETGTEISGRSASKNGRSRAVSSAADIGTKPGRDDSAPTSMMSAPSSTICRARAIAFSGVFHSPPSEKESGVTLQQQVAGNFYQISFMLYDLKEKGLYDNATILIVADHGDNHVGEYPMFLLKEAGATGPYRTSGAPVSYFDIPPYLASLAGEKLDNEYSMELKALDEDTLF